MTNSNNTDLFDSFFRRADLDGDGQISGAEAVGFFQGSGLPTHVLAQVEELEKEILDSRQKIEFYSVKMQELVKWLRFYIKVDVTIDLMRSQQGYLLISMRYLSFLRATCVFQVETLGKKYEEKYKQTGDVASKLTIEEATFHDIQEHAENIQSSLEERVKTVNEHCKLYGLRSKPISLVELPFGISMIPAIFYPFQRSCCIFLHWLPRIFTFAFYIRMITCSLPLDLSLGRQPGIQEAAADWDEGWDKFDNKGMLNNCLLDLVDFDFALEGLEFLFTWVHDAFFSALSLNLIKALMTFRSGFTFVKELTLDVRNVVASPKQKTSFPKETTSTDKDSIAKSEKVSRPIKSNSEKDLLDHQHENGTLKCPPDKNSPHAKEIQTDGGGTEAVHSGDIIVEPGWGTFDDTHYDTESAWGFYSVSGKSMDFSIGELGLNPIKTRSSHGDNMLPGKGQFMFDSIPSTLAHNQGNSSYAFADSVPSTPAYNPQNAFADSVPSTPAYNTGKSPVSFADSIPSTPAYNFGNSPRRFSEGSEDHSFDSFSRALRTRMKVMDSHQGLIPLENLETLIEVMGFQGLTHSESLIRVMGSQGLTHLQSDQNHGFSRDTDHSHGFLKMDSFNTHDSGFFQSSDNSLARFDSSVRGSKDFDNSHGFPSFDDTDPFGSSGPFRTSLESGSGSIGDSRIQAGHGDEPGEEASVFSTAAMLLYSTLDEASAALGRNLTVAETLWFNYSAKKSDYYLFCHNILFLFLIFSVVPLPLFFTNLWRSAGLDKYKIQPKVKLSPSEEFKCYKDVTRMNQSQGMSVYLITTRRQKDFWLLA
ncbi:hypothetical protein POTOM_027123 [Populus tomentosa]|uniref:EF-hand domain-containing protein n=1 Tax=Populus tomentosa TaxID=118781 RepID=A0A8X7ZF84_POPTO|nr:hypothetical protein POTOM_027123 [Populus tomentosa]